MSRRPSRGHPSQRRSRDPTEKQWREILEDTNKGTSKAFVDSAFWLPHDVDEELIEALRAFERSSSKDKKGKDKKLIELLRRRADIPAYLPSRVVYLFLADLLDRYELKRPRGGQRIALYDLPDQHRRLMMAKRDMDNGESLNQAARDWGLLEAELDKYRRGKRGAAERERERRLRKTR